MNVLIFVVTMLMVLAAMTYARLESFRDLMGLKIQFEWYMNEHERADYNERETEKYNKMHIKKIKKTVGDEEDPEDDGEEKACSKIPFGYFINETSSDYPEDHYKQFYLILKTVMQNVYGQEAFFQTVEEERPDILDELIEGMQPAFENLPSDMAKNFKSDNLSSLDFGDKDLNQVFYKMLQDEEKSGTPSLLKYVTLSAKKNAKKIRIYLAQENVLLAIYEDPALVQEIVDTRNDLYKKVSSKDEEEKLDKDKAKEQFEKKFTGQQRPGLDQKILDFSVSETDPKSYK